MSAETPKTQKATGNLGSFPSMASCSGATGIPLSVLKGAKKAGCPAFDQSNRVHLEPLLRFIFSENGSMGQDWAKRHERADALIAEKKLAVLEGELVDINTVTEQQDRCCARAVAVLQQKFETELPPKQDGLPAVKIAEMNRKALDQVRAILSQEEAYA
jgi:hypothetical protein